MTLDDIAQRDIKNIRRALWQIQPARPTYASVRLYLKVKVAGLRACNQAERQPSDQAIRNARRYGIFIGALGRTA